MTASYTTSNPDVVLSVEGVVVEYQMQAIRTSTLKEAVIRSLRGTNQVMTTKALGGVSVTAKQGECLALIGHNGCGKSTLLKVIAGIIKPSQGSSQVKGRIAPLIELGAGFDPELTGRENVYLSCSLLGLTKKEIEDRLPEIESFAELGPFFEAPVKTYSSGMYMRLGFACTTAIDADLLLIDEILAVGDENFQRKCVEKMQATRSAGVTTVLVSHDLGVVERMADRVLVLDHGKVVYEGRPAPAVAHYHRLMEEERLAKLAPLERAEELRRERLKLNDDQAIAVVKGVAKIVAARVHGATYLGPMPSGKPWCLVLDIDIQAPFDEPPVIGYAINNARNSRLFGGNTRSHHLADGMNLNNLCNVGIHTVIFEFETMPLASGNYIVVAAIHDHRLERTIDINGHAIAFKVDDEGDLHNFDDDQLATHLRRAIIRLNI